MNTKGAKGVEVNRSTFDSKPEELQKACCLLQGRSLGAGRGRGRGELREDAGDSGIWIARGGFHHS